MDLRRSHRTTSAGPGELQQPRGRMILGKGDDPGREQGTADVADLNHQRVDVHSIEPQWFEACSSIRPDPTHGSQTLFERTSPLSSLLCEKEGDKRVQKVLDSARGLRTYVAARLELFTAAARG
jgi:hypothetical protein